MTNSKNLPRGAGKKKKPSKTQEVKELKREVRELNSELKKQKKLSDKYETLLGELSYYKECSTYLGCSVALGLPVINNDWQWCIYCRIRLALGLPVKAELREYHLLEEDSEENDFSSPRTKLAALKKKRIKIYAPVRPPHE